MKYNETFKLHLCFKVVLGNGNFFTSSHFVMIFAEIVKIYIHVFKVRICGLFNALTNFHF